MTLCPGDLREGRMTELDKNEKFYPIASISNTLPIDETPLPKVR